MNNPHTGEAWRLNTEASLDNEWTEQQRLIIATRAQVEATLALAYEQRTANLIALAQMEHRNSTTVGFHADYDSAAIHERLGVQEPEPPKPAPVEHYRVGPARCNCGFDAYKINAIMVDYSEEFAHHLRMNR